ncbi:hypothetical protein NPIL_694161 [Nephila pilipes]|uniref:Uncharacterized protein n=1 Tax=Nephila pilipes TaxID=299642 RepID=A0A8X6TV41_NEPPI|nr:hypothetical protein NPIL_694161 [Nephila pilipes]
MIWNSTVQTNREIRFQVRRKYGTLFMLDVETSHCGKRFSNLSSPLSQIEQCASAPCFCQSSGYHRDSEECEHCQKCFLCRDSCDMRNIYVSSKLKDSLFVT